MTQGKTENKHQALEIAADIYADVRMKYHGMYTLWANGIMSYYSCNANTAMLAIEKIQSLQQKYQA